jgi:hypothetical protein
MSVNIPYELVEQFVRGNGVIFVGSGLSQGAGLPGWGELLKPLGDSLDLPQRLRIFQAKVRAVRAALASECETRCWLLIDWTLDKVPIWGCR